MKKKAKQVFDKWHKTWQDNRDGKTICFISRGEWSDPQIAYEGKLLNYWDVLDLACPENASENYEPTDEEWLCGCIDSSYGHSESGVELDDFTQSDVLSVTRIININQ